MLVFVVRCLCCACVRARARVCVIHWHCSAQLSMFNMEKRYRNKIIIILLLLLTCISVPQHVQLYEQIPTLRYTSMLPERVCMFVSNKQQLKEQKCLREERGHLDI